MGRKRKAGDHLRIIEKVYDAALDPGRWTGALEELRAITSAGVVNLVSQNFKENSVDLLISIGGEGEWEDMYAGRLKGDNPLLDAILGREDPVFSSQELENGKAFLNSALYRDVLAPHDLHFMAGLIAFRDEVRITRVECLRSKASGRFQKTELDCLLEMAPHFRRALQMNRKFWDTLTEHQAALRILDTLDLGVILLDSEGLPMYQNQYAEEVLSDEGALMIRRGKLQALTIGETDVLGEHIFEAVRTGLGRGTYPGGILTLGMKHNRPLYLQVTPMRTEQIDLGHAKVCAALFLRRPDKAHAVPLDALKEQFGLTNAEAAVMHELDKGLNLDQIAESIHISKHTVRDHLKSIYQKTGTRRQVELVRLVFASPTSFIRESEMMGLSLAGPLERRRQSDRRENLRPVIMS